MLRTSLDGDFIHHVIFFMNPAGFTSERLLKYDKEGELSPGLGCFQHENSE